MQNKFRVWDTKLKKWLFGYEYKNLGGFSLFGEVVLMGQLNSVSLDRLNDLLVETFTGEKDKSENDVYIGDIFEDMLNSGKKGVVKFGKYYNCFDKKEVTQFGGHIGFYVDFGTDIIRKDLHYWTKNKSKIGNIHDNSDLLS